MKTVPSRHTTYAGGNNQYICLKNNIELSFFTLGRAELHWNFSSIPEDGSDIYRFSNKKWVLTMSFDISEYQQHPLGLNPGPLDHHANALLTELSQHLVASVNHHGLCKVMFY